MTNLRHDLPHYAVFHSRNVDQQCPLCHMAEATNWEDLQLRMERAVVIVQDNVAAVQQKAMDQMVHVDVT